MAKFQKGQSRPKGAGRAPGTPNRATTSLLQKCEDKGLDVFEAMIELAIEAEGHSKFSMLESIAQYLFPKRKAMELTAEVNVEAAKKVEEIERLTKEQKIKMLETNLKKLRGE